MIKKIGMKLALAVCVSAFSFAANAQVTPVTKSKTASIEVSATVESNCEITANPLVFGKYDPLSKTDATATSSITLTCVKNTQVVSVGLSGLVGTSGIRQMSNGSGTLDYQVYKAGDAAGVSCNSGTALSVWAKDNDALKPGITTDATAKSYNLCGVITAGQDVSAGDAKDILTATVSY